MRGAASLAFAVVVYTAFAAAVATAGGCAVASRGFCPTPHLPKGLLPLSGAPAPDLGAAVRKCVHCGTNCRPHVGRRTSHTLPTSAAPAVFWAESDHTLAAALQTALDEILKGTFVVGAAHSVTSHPAAEAATGTASTSSSLMPVRLRVPHVRVLVATLPPTPATAGAIIAPSLRCSTASTRVAAVLAPVPSALHLPDNDLGAHSAAIFSCDACVPSVEPRPDVMPSHLNPEATSAAVHAVCLAERCADLRITSQFAPGKRITVEHVESPSPCCIPCRHQPSQPSHAALDIIALDAAWGGRRSCSSSPRSVSDAPRVAVGGVAAQDRTPVELAGRVPLANEPHAIHPNLLFAVVMEPSSSCKASPATGLNVAKHLPTMTPGELEVSVFRPPQPTPDGVPRPVLVLMRAPLLCSPRSATPSSTPPPSMVVLSTVTLLSTASAAPNGTHVTASTGEGVTACAPPWPRTPTDTLGVVVAIQFIMESSGVGLTVVAAMVSGVDVAATFGGDEGAGTLHSAAYTTLANDTLWPWGGLEVDAALSVGATVRAAVILGSM